MRGARGARREDPSMGEVEEMLRAAENNLLLNLIRDSHSTAPRLEPPSFPTSLLSSSSSSRSPLDADLAARFDALKLPSAPPPAKQPKSATTPSAPAPPPSVTPKDSVTAAERGGGDGPEDEWSAILGDDLNARFAALKGTSSAATISSQAGPVVDQKLVLWERRKEDSCDGTEDVSENEVEKVLQWAMDAARLEPSSSIKAGDGGNSIEDDDNKEEEEEEDKDSDDEDDENRKRPAGTKAQVKGDGPKKWFFF